MVKDWGGRSGKRVKGKENGLADEGGRDFELRRRCRRGGREGSSREG